MNPNTIGNITGTSVVLFFFSAPVFLIVLILRFALQSFVSLGVMQFIKVALWVSGALCAPLIIILLIILIGTVAQDLKKRVVK